MNADVDQVMKQVRRQTMLNIAVSSKTDAAAKLLSDQPIVESVEVQGAPTPAQASQGQTAGTKKQTIVVTLKPDVIDYSPLATFLVQQGFQITLFSEEELNLETAFLALTKGITA